MTASTSRIVARRRQFVPAEVTFGLPSLGYRRTRRHVALCPHTVSIEGGS
jgi:hypothetical protein